MKQTRRKHEAGFKAKVALSAVGDQQTVPELATRYGVAPSQIFAWKKLLLEKAGVVFSEGKPAPVEEGPGREELLRKIGELTMERDFLANGLRRFR